MDIQNTFNNKNFYKNNTKSFTSDLLIGFFIIVVIIIFIISVNVVSCDNNSNVKERFQSIDLFYTDEELSNILNNNTQNIMLAKRAIALLNSLDYNYNNMTEENKINGVITILNYLINDYFIPITSPPTQNSNIDLYYFLKNVMNEKLEKLNLSYGQIYIYNRQKSNIDSNTVILRQIPPINLEKNTYSYHLGNLRSRLINNKNNILQQKRQDKKITEMLINMNDLNKLINIYQT